MLSLRSAPIDQKIFWGFSGLVLLALGTAILFDATVLMLLPIALLVGAIAITDYKKIFLLFFLVLPFSIEIFLPSGIGTDLPTEPIALLLSAIALLVFIQNFNNINAEFIKHPITLIIIAQLTWILFTAILSQNIIISVKFLLAKSWYVIPFFFLPFVLIKNRTDIEKVFKVLIFSTSFVVMMVMVKHAMTGFSFKTINKAAHPIFRNHVIYAALLVILLPFIYHLKYWAKGHFKKLAWIALLCLYLAAIYFSYTRAAHLCVFISIAAYYVIKYRWTKIAVYSSLVVAMFVVVSLVKNNKYLDFSPDYHKTITHINFDNLLEATYKMEDISTMERVYRWVSGLQMVKERPILGFGPGCFYPFYKEYTVSSFRTYVSDNPDKSGVHNYYFMSLIEQGALGLLIVLFLCILPVLYGEKLYHQLTDARDKSLVMATILAIITIDCLLLINDLLETDKLGSLFLFFLSILVLMDVRNRHLLAANKKV